MSRNGSGTYSLPTGNPVVTNTVISSTWANNTLNDIASALTGSLASDGQTPATGNLNLANNKILNLDDGTSPTDAINLGQLTAALTGISGRVAQIIQSVYTSSTSTNSSGFVTTSHNLTITPSSTSSKILLLNTCKLYQTDEYNASQNAQTTLYRNSTNLAGGSNSFTEASSGYANSNYTTAAINYVDQPSTTSATIYTVYLRAVGGAATAVYDGPAMLIAMEIL